MQIKVFENSICLWKCDSIETSERERESCVCNANDIGIKWGKSEPVWIETHSFNMHYILCTLYVAYTHCTNDCFWAASTAFAIDDNHLPFAIIDANLFWCRRNGDAKDMSNQDFPFDAVVKENRSALLIFPSFGCCQSI